MKHVEAYWKQVTELGLYPKRYEVIGKSGNRWQISEPENDTVLEVTNFCSNDVLGLSQHPDVKAATIKAVETYGAGNSSCTMYCGRIAPHDKLEKTISNFKKIPYTHTFLNAWMALQAFTDTYSQLSMRLPNYPTNLKTLFLLDSDSHSCINAAALNSKNGIAGQLFSNRNHQVEVKPYKHNDMKSLASRMERFAKPGCNVVVMTDSVFSMSGNVCNLPGILEILVNYPGTALLCDEAHASGAIGLHGGGIYDHYNIDPASIHQRGLHPILLTTFSKFAGSIGAAISSFSKDLVTLLDAARTSCGTASLGAPQAAAAQKSIEILQAHPELVTRLHNNTVYLRKELTERGFEVFGETHILAVKTEVFPEKFTEHLIHEHNVWVTPVWFVAKPCLRIMVNSTLTKSEMDHLIDAMTKTRAFFSSVAA
ncbi:MAG: aminotransferase class I/II-fold pyridoxal phosphate-dependent enzyme [Xenococcus sp. (in: cyanobacteria)]